MLAKLRAHFAHLLTFLNYIGAIVLAYALQNPGAAAELKGLLPVSLQPYAPALALGWFFLIQYAKAQAIAKARRP